VLTFGWHRIPNHKMVHPQKFSYWTSSYKTSRVSSYQRSSLPNVQITKRSITKGPDFQCPVIKRSVTGQYKVQLIYWLILFWDRLGQKSTKARSIWWSKLVLATQAASNKSLFKTLIHSISRGMFWFKLSAWWRTARSMRNSDPFGTTFPSGVDFILG
jgi:hypothetical protein